MKATALLLAAATTLAACLVDIDFDGTSFSCADGMCPDGFTCVEETCVAESGGGDGGPGGDGGGADAAPDASLLPTCQEQFGAAPAFMLCAEAADSCEFFIQTEVNAACETICPEYGAECVSSFDATPGGTECTRETEDGCAITHQSQICVCSRG